MFARKMSRREMLKGLGLVMASTALAACAPKVLKETVIVEKPVEKVVKETVIVEGTPQVVEKVVTATPAPKKPVTLTTNTQYWDVNTWPLSTEEYRKLLDANGFDWLTMEWEQTDAATLETRMAAGDAPDIIFVYPELAIPWAARKQLVALTSYIDADPDWKKDVDAFIKSMNEGYVYKGELYGLTIAAEAECFSYNPKQFEKKGIKKPSEIGADAWTLEKFAETIQAVTDGPDDEPLGEVPMYGWDCELGYNTGLGDILYSYGGKYFSEDGKKALLNSPEFVEALAFAMKQVQDGWAANGLELTKQGEWLCLALANQKVASVIAGDWCWGWTHKTQLEREEFEPEMFYVPSGPAGRHPLAHSAGEAIYTNTKNLEAALEYVKFGFTKEYQEATARMYEEAPRYPARHDAAGPIYEKKLLPDFFPKLFDDSWPSPTTPTINFMGIQGYWNDTWNAVLLGQDTRPLQEVQDELNERTQKDMDAASAGLDL